MVLLVTGAWRDARDFIPRLTASGYEVFYLQNEKDELPCPYDRIEAVVCNALFLHYDIWKFSSLKLIQLTSAGLDRVPLDYIREHGIKLFNARNVYNIPMAEHAVASALQFFRETGFFAENQKNRNWEKRRSLRELYGKTVCIIGCGNVGTECAKRFDAFGCDVIGVDTVPNDNASFRRVYTADEIHSAIGRSDVVVLTLPLTAETEGLADDRFFGCLKDGCVLINISRGKLIRTDSLVKALSEKEIYAALDVFEEEPLSSDSPLWSMKNVIITPHNSFVGDGNSGRFNQLISEIFLNGQNTGYPVDGK